MANVAGRRMTAEIDGDFVVFLIGAKLDKFHREQFERCRQLDAHRRLRGCGEARRWAKNDRISSRAAIVG